MKFLVDAHLPRKLVAQFKALGHDALHTLDLPKANRTPDADIVAQADADERVVVSKDADFVHAHTATGHPARVLVVATGNISNVELLALFARSDRAIAVAFATCSLVELRRDALVLRGPATGVPP